jgi:hypothetical protein
MADFRHRADLMTGVMHQALIGGSRKGSMIEAINSLGLQSGLELCLDAGAASSYDGSSQTWTDLSGNGYSFFRGTTSGSEGSDPTFNGVSGRQSSSEYFSYDGGDVFTISVSNPAWVNNLFKNNALGTVVLWSWFNTTADFQNMIGCQGTSGGFWYFSANPTNTFGFLAGDDAANTELSFTSTMTFTEDAWQFLGFAVDEAGNSHRLHLNGTSEEKTGTMPSPSVTNSNSPLKIGSGGTSSPTYPIESGGRVNCVAAWSRALTATELSDLFGVMRGKFGV